MIAATFDSCADYLLNIGPDWTTLVRGTFEALTQYETGLTGRESRRPHAATMRAKFAYLATVADDDALALQAALRAHQDEPVLMPAWPLAQPWSSRASIATTGGLRIAYKADWSQWSIYGDTEPSWPAADDICAPLLWGRIDSREIVWMSPTVVSWDVQFVESGSAVYALQPTPQEWPTGPALAHYSTTPNLWPFAVDWARGKASFLISIKREQIGFGREQIPTLYPQEVARQATAEVCTSSPADQWQVLRFFLDHGTGRSFWVALLQGVRSLASDIAGGSTSVAVQLADGLAAGDYVAFTSGPSVVATGHVQSVSGTTVAMFDAPGALPAASTLVAPLMLARMDKPRIQIDWSTGNVASVSFAFVEVPPEVDPTADETAGATIGLLPARAYIYDVAQTLGGITVTDRWTSYESPVAVGSYIYAPRKMDHGVIRQSLFLDRDELEIRSEVVAGDVLVAMATAQSESPVRITISRADVYASTGSSPTVLFTGEVVKVSVKGSTLSARVVPAGSVFDRLFPRFRMQPGCNHALFSVGCSLLAANWKFTASMVTPGTPGYPFTFGVGSLARVSGSMPTITAGWFAGGWVEFGTGSATVRRSILDNTAAVSSALTLTLGRDPNPFPVAGDSVALYPGCNGDASTCSGKFANFANFGGHPFIPPANPSLVKISQNVAGGKK